MSFIATCEAFSGVVIFEIFIDYEFCMENAYEIFSHAEVTYYSLVINFV